MKPKRVIYRVRWDKKFKNWQVLFKDPDGGVPDWGIVGTYSLKVDAVQRGVRGALWVASEPNPRPSQLVVFTKKGRISFERTYPRSSDPKRHKG